MVLALLAMQANEALLLLLFLVTYPPRVRLEMLLVELLSALVSQLS